MTRTLWGTLVVIAACAPPAARPVDVAPCNTPNSRATLSQVPLVVEGEDARLVVESPRLACPGATLEATVEVFDPQNLPVAATVAAGTSSVTLQFHTATPGSWFVRVTFLPSQGTTQFVVPVATRRPKDAPVVETFPIDMSLCLALARTPHGGVVCELPSDQSTRFFRSGVEVASFHGRAVAVAGDVVWSVDDFGALERRRDTGTELLLEGSLNTAFLPSTVSSESWHTETDAVRSFDSTRSAFLAHWDGQSLVEASRVGGLFFGRWLDIEGNHLVVIDPGGAVTDLGGGVDPLPVVVSSVVARDEFGVWGKNLFDNTLVLAQRPWSNSVHLELALPSTAMLEVMGVGAEAHPAFTRAAHPVLLGVRGGVLEFESWTLVATTTLVTSKYVIALDSSVPEQVRFYAR